MELKAAVEPSEKASVPVPRQPGSHRREPTWDAIDWVWTFSVLERASHIWFLTVCAKVKRVFRVQV